MIRILCQLIFVFIDTAFSVVYFPNLRVFHKHSSKDIEKFLRDVQFQSFNQPHIGYSVQKNENNPISPSSKYRTNYLSVNIGQGQDVFRQATDVLKKFSMIKCMGWTEVHCLKLPFLDGNSKSDEKPDSTGLNLWDSKPFDLREGKPLCTLAKCFGFIWVLNPCKIVKSTLSSESSAHKSKSDCNVIHQIAFSTVNGHLLAGEERFRVMHNKLTDVVTFDMYSFSKPSNLLGLMALPYVRHVQKSFFRDQAKYMKILLSEGEVIVENQIIKS